MKLRKCFEIVTYVKHNTFLITISLGLFIFSVHILRHRTNSLLSYARTDLLYRPGPDTFIIYEILWIASKKISYFVNTTEINTHFSPSLVIRLFYPKMQNIFRIAKTITWSLYICLCARHLLLAITGTWRVKIHRWGVSLQLAQYTRCLLCMQIWRGLTS